MLFLYFVESYMGSCNLRWTEMESKKKKKKKKNNQYPIGVSRTTCGSEKGKCLHMVMLVTFINIILHYYDSLINRIREVDAIMIHDTCKTLTIIYTQTH